jgi:hypothetical protein
MKGDTGTSGSVFGVGVSAANTISGRLEEL